ncbi:autophagy related lipase [Diplocarpon rosae]|nr:autophagy related lipase [Diplocarpon rosae]
MRVHGQTSPTCTSAGRVTAGLLLSFLALSTPISAVHDSASQQSTPLLPPFISSPETSSPRTKDHLFTLRHVFHHGDLNRPAVHRRLDIPKTSPGLWIESEDGNIEEVSRPLVVRTSPMKIHRLKDTRPSVVDPMVAAAREYSQVWASLPEVWTMDEVEGPDVTSMETILTFAQMAANAYVEKPDTGDWKDVHGGFNRTNDVGFGWDSDGLRGYLYANEDNSTIVIGLKGTTLAIWDGDGTTTNDKENDNLFFSCCCGQQGSSFYRQTSLKKENRYYAAARTLYGNVTAMYPGAEVWMSGHSLGGSVSAMIGLTYGKPVLTFQAVPDALPANRLGLPVPPGVDPDRPGQREYTGAFHFGQNADPIYMGTCNGATASCSYAGYALESACHTGRECVFDVVNSNGTRVSIITHKIIYVIENVLKRWTKAPECKFTSECYDCPLWKEVTGNVTGTSTLPSSTSTKVRTRTSTCQTPGWWGCLDETTTASGPTTSTSTTTTSTSTSTCKTPGWFGCKDETTTIRSSSSTSPFTPTKTSTSACKTPGWFGCNDPIFTSVISVSVIPSSADCGPSGLVRGCNDQTTTKIRSHSITSPPPMPTLTSSSSTSTHSCTSKEWFGLICIDPSPKPLHKANRTPQCVRRSWLGICNEWDGISVVSKEEI